MTMLNETSESTEETTTIEEHQEEVDSIDVSKYSKEELLKFILNLKAEDNLSKAGSLLKNVKAQFEGLLETERNVAREAFIASGGSAGDFEFRKDDTTQKFEKSAEQLREKIAHLQATIEKDKEKNLRDKNALLDRLRTLISAEETTTSITTLKDLQSEWKKIGSVPANYSQDLWANYHALVERFYNNRSIYFELKELDRKKNLEAKAEVIEKAEKLVELGSISQAIKELKALHEEYKHIGPVPKEDQEALWNKFKMVSDKVYEKRNEHYEATKREQEENFQKKSALVDSIQELVNFTSDRIDDWKAKTTEVLGIQEAWKLIGNMPFEKGKETSKRFWAACKTYFHHKDAFFKQLEEKKDQNLKLKTELCEKAEQLKDSEDFATTANTLKDLQKTWDTIGPVPIKQKEAIFKRFKEACDLFFKKKRDHNAEVEKEYVVNLQKKEAICQEIENFAVEKRQEPERLKELQQQWNAIGFVPKNDIKTINEKYNKALHSYIKTIETNDSAGSSGRNLRLSLEVSAMRNSPDAGKKIQRKEGDVMKRISALKSEIDRYNINMEFFGRSKNAELLKQDVQAKIDLASKEIKDLQDQMKIIRQS